jgi:hypothetical protein
MIQSSKYPHNDSQTNASRIAAIKAQFETLVGELRTRVGDERTLEVLAPLLPWLQEEDYPQPIQAVTHELEYLDGHDFAAEVSAMRRGE